MEAIALSDRLVDIRPVTMRDADEVVAAVRREVARRGPDGAYLNGWDPLLQNGLPEPTLSWLDEIAPDDPLVIIHNSGHKAYLQLARRPARRPQPRHRRPQGRQVRPRRTTATSTAPPRKPARCSRC